MARIEPSTVLKYYMQQGINQRIRDADDEYYAEEPRYVDKGDALLVVKIPEFAMSPLTVDNIIGKMRKHKGVVIDLRGNPGGFVKTLERFLGGMFEKDLKIFDRVARDSTTPVIVSGRGHNAFTGRLTVLVDSESASASELFARVLQLEKRAFVLGDRASGFVMQAREHPHETSYNYAISVTNADLIMSDGKSLEHVGVEPDFVVLPTAEDLASGRDPAMSKAAVLVGAHLTPEEAGAAFPYRDLKPR